jgi:hypothetical protein
MLKLREERAKVVLRAKMDAGGLPVDVCIRDVSSFGMMLQAASPPPRGTYVEIETDRDSVVGRVIWAGDRKFGIKTRDRINLARMLGRHNLPGGTGGIPARIPRARDLAATPHPEGARLLGRAIDFTIIAAAAAALASILGWIAYGALSDPFKAVSAILG